MFVTQMLPVGVTLAKDEAVSRFTFRRAIGCLIVIACFAGIGGAVALGIGTADTASQAKNYIQAITYGLGWQGLVGGLMGILLAG